VTGGAAAGGARAAGRLAKVLLVGAAGLVAGFLVLALLLSAISERHDVCACRDGSRRAGWAWALRSPAAHCGELCRESGGGDVVPAPPRSPARR
jgi:hypothetical protein